MFVEGEVLEALANLIVAGTDELPVNDDAEWHGWSSDTAKVMQDVLDELNGHDLFPALRSAAARVQVRAGRRD